jgi:hypothetical protein
MWPDILMPKACGLAGSTGPDGSNAQAVHALGETGKGVNVGVVSASNTRITHEAFKDPNGVSHAFAYDFTTVDGNDIGISWHDTFMAGIVASRGGASHPDDIGVAPGANIHSARIQNDSGQMTNVFLTDALDELIIEQNCRVIATGVQSIMIPDGNSLWTKMYDYYAYEYDAVFTNPSGNGAPAVTVMGDAYNGITTGGLAIPEPETEPDVYLTVGSASNSGPTLDGRRKPEIVAPTHNQTVPTSSSDTAWDTADKNGLGLTSYSGPQAAGVAALLLGAADETGDPNDNRSEVIKAVIVNSAFPNINDKNNNPTYPADPNNTWHGDRGYGRIDALRAYELLNADQVIADANTTQQKGWAYDTMTDYERHTYSLVGAKNHRLVLTVTWHREITRDGLVFTIEESPKFNLDLTIRDPNGIVIFSEAATLDNLEKVDLLLAKDGMYEITLDNTTGKSRDYGLAFELLAPLPGDFEPIDYIVDTGDLLVMVWQWLAEEPDMEANLIGADIVNLEDFVEFVKHWLEIDPAYHN